MITLNGITIIIQDVCLRISCKFGTTVKFLPRNLQFLITRREGYIKAITSKYARLLEQWTLIQKTNFLRLICSSVATLRLNI